jgi:hypothetical protein
MHDGIQGHFSCPRDEQRGAYQGVMSLHKLTAGDGYTYLTRQVAAADATDKGHTSLCRVS